MNTPQIVSAQSEATKTSKGLRVWLIVFAVSAVLSIISAVVGNQSVIITGVMVVAAAMVVLKVSKREQKMFAEAGE